MFDPLPSLPPPLPTPILVPNHRNLAFPVSQLSNKSLNHSFLSSSANSSSIMQHPPSGRSSSPPVPVLVPAPTVSPVPSPPSPTTPTSSRSLARRHRTCFGLIASLKFSLILTVKAFTLLVWCILLTIQIQKKKKTSSSSQNSSTDSSPSSSQPGTPRPSSSSLSSCSVSSNYYETLQLPLTASLEEIKSSHRRLAIRYHPDKFSLLYDTAAASSTQTPTENERLNALSVCKDTFIAVQEAYEVLSNPMERKRYDYSLRMNIQYNKLRQQQQHHAATQTKTE